MNPKIIIFAGTAMISLFVMLSCQTTAKMGTTPDFTSINDGLFEGYFHGGLNSAKELVEIKDKKITAITLLEHNCSPIGKKANNQIPRRIIETQSADVDAVSGATNSSHVIINAVQNAINQSYKSQTDKNF